MQKDLGFKGVDAWWVTALDSGRLPGQDSLQEEPTGGRKAWEKAKQRVPTDRLYAAYENWSKSRKGEYEAAENRVFGRKLKVLCSGIERVQIRMKSGELPRVYEIPALAECRAAWDLATKSKRAWDQCEDRIVDDSDDNRDLLG